MVKITITIEIDTEPLPALPPGGLAARVLEAMNTLIDRHEAPCPTNIAKLLDVQPGAISSPLRELVKRGLVYKGEKIGRKQPYYPKD